MSRAELRSLALLLQLVLCLDCCPVPHRFSHISEVWQMHTTLLTDPSKKGSTDTVPVTVHDAVIVAPGRGLRRRMCSAFSRKQVPLRSSRMDTKKQVVILEKKPNKPITNTLSIKINPLAQRKGMSPALTKQLPASRGMLGRPRLANPEAFASCAQHLELARAVSPPEPCSHGQLRAVRSMRAISSPAASNRPVLWAAVAALLFFPSGPSVSSSKGVSTCGYSCSKTHMSKLGSFSFPAEASGSVACSANSLAGRAASRSGAK